jgi:hypothetical protein
MAELTLDLPAPAIVDVEASRGEARWSVARSGWKKLLPDLPDEVIALLAAPVVVSAAALGGSDDEDERYPAPAEPCAALNFSYRGDCTPSFLAPAPPRSRRARRRI